jgi:hypothetical protein
MLDVSWIEQLSSATIATSKEPIIRLPEKYAEYSQVFSKMQANRLFPH